jgi:hypothetical protein
MSQEIFNQNQIKKDPLAEAEFERVLRALNQLTSVVVGARHAKESERLKDDPLGRIQKCMELTILEHSEAIQEFRDPNSSKKVDQANRKMNSLASLAILADLVEKSAWD